MVRYTRTAWIALGLLLLGVHSARAGSFSTGAVTTSADLQLGSGSDWLAQNTGSASAVTVGGSVFAAESYFTGAGTNPFSASFSFADPNLNSLLESVRYENPTLSDSLPVTSGNSYTLQLLFDDGTFTTPGSRVMNISIGTDVLTGFDPNVITGGNNSTTGAFVDYSFTATGSTLPITITSTSGASAILSGFSLLNTTVSTPEPSSAVLCGLGVMGLIAVGFRRRTASKA